MQKQIWKQANDISFFFQNTPIGPIGPNDLAVTLLTHWC